ncbi:MAG: thioredoxin domain-containing protein [Minicystis sp.]
MTPGTIFAGEFRILTPISEGDGGQVYAAEHLRTGVQHVLEVLPRELGQADMGLRPRLEFAARSAPGGQDPVSPTFVAGVDLSTGLPWIAAKILEGYDLMKAREALGPIKQAAGIGVPGIATPPPIAAAPPAPWDQPPGAQAGWGPPAGGGYGGGPPMGPPPGAWPAGPLPPQPGWGAKPQPASKAPIFIIVGVVGAVFMLLLIGVAGAAFSRFKSRAAEARAEAERVAAEAATGVSAGNCSVPVSTKDPVWGSAVAPVTIVTFSDFECPFCSKASRTVDQLRDKYGPTELRIVWKHDPLPFHANAKPAAMASQSVFDLGGSPAFWKFHDKAFANQRGLTTENFETWAQEAGVDMTRWRAKNAAESGKEKVEADIALGKSIGVTGTPQFYVNGTHLSGAQPLEKFVTTIDEEMQKARAAIAAGTPASRIYVEMTNTNFAKPVGDKGEKGEKGEKEKAPTDEITVWKVPVAESPVRGSKTAQVTIIEFADFQCPFCARVEATLADVQKTYGSKVRIVWKNNPLPFHTHAEPAAELAMEALTEKGESGFWAAHDLLFKEQTHLDEDDLLGHARKLGLDGGKVASAIRTKKYKAAIEADQGLADDFEASGTPHFFINGRRLTGAQPPEKFKAMIDEELRKAEALLARGVAPQDLYAELTREGKTPAGPDRKDAGPIPAKAPWKGGEHAKVVIQEFSDFQCPFCKRVEDTLGQVMSSYGDRVKLVWRHKPLPMHKDAALAAEAAQEVFAQGGNKQFWAYHALLFKNQGETDGLSRRALEGYAEGLNVNMGKLRISLDGHLQKAYVDEEIAASDRAGISGTPAFIINGYYLSGAQPPAKFKKIIDRALAEAER